MKFVSPKVFLIAATDLESGIYDWLDHLGVEGWETDTEESAQVLIEAAGRRCYRAFQAEGVSVSEQNPNLRKVREGNTEYLRNILSSKHGSVLEHGNVSVAFENVSRVVTHELVRHRVGTAYSQESLRFVRPTELKMYFPDIYREVLAERADKVSKLYKTTVEFLEGVQEELVKICGLDSMKDFSLKKKIQSANRRLMPIGMATGIVVTSNHRNWRHMIQMRTSRHAEEEIRLVFAFVASLLSRKFPALYQDMEKNTDVSKVPEYTFANEKI